MNLEQAASGVKPPATVVVFNRGIGALWSEWGGLSAYYKNMSNANTWVYSSGNRGSFSILFLYSSGYIVRYNYPGNGSGPYLGWCYRQL